MNALISYVWDHFEKTSDRLKVICKHCKQNLKFHKATSSLRSHLENKHRLLDPRRVVMSSDNTTSSNQLQVDVLFKCKKPLDPETKAMLDKSVMEFMIESEQPFTIVERKSFERLCSNLNERYTPPCAKTAKSLMIHEAAHVRNEIRKRVKEIKYGACACIDLWSSSAQESYLGVDIHYVTEGFKLEDLTLGVFPFEHPHTTLRLYEMLTNVFEEFELQEKISSIITDNGSNMLALKRHFPNIEMMQCSVHTLQLSVKQLFQMNADVIEKCRRLVLHFSHSNKDNELLLGIQEFTREGQEAISYIGDMAVRWNSTNMMLNRILELRTSLHGLAHSVMENPKESLSPSFHKVLLTETDYDQIAILTRLLEPLALVSNVLQTSQSSVVSQVYPLTRMLLSVYEKPVEDDAIDSLRKEILKDLKERWSNLSETYLIVCFLDPRFKDHISLDASQRERVVHQIRSLCMQSEKYQDHRKKGEIASNDDCIEKAQRSLYQQQYFATFKRAKVRDEVDKYLDLDPIDASDDRFDLLTWWKLHELQFPSLSILCRKYMCRMSSTASVEGIFSMTGNILGWNRTKLDANMLNNILLLKKFYLKASSA